MIQRVKAKKHLGQHFLKDRSIAAEIVNALVKVYEQGTVLEVGPGMGVLTGFLLEQKKLQTWAAEIDTESVSYLMAQWPSISEHLIQESFLNIDLSARFAQELAIIGNFPYNISSQIVFHILDHKDRIPVMVGMFQKEVAERICARPGGKEYGIISLLTQAHYDAEYLFTVEAHVFDPPPQVRSGVMRMVRKNAPMPCNETLFKQVVKTAFNQRRKKLRNALAQLNPGDELLGEFASKRAEELSLDDFYTLTQIIENNS